MGVPLREATRRATDFVAHMGYGLPIGGVLATENAVIAYVSGLGEFMPQLVKMAPSGEWPED